MPSLFKRLFRGGSSDDEEPAVPEEILHLVEGEESEPHDREDDSASPEDDEFRAAEAEAEAEAEHRDGDPDSSEETGDEADPESLEASAQQDGAEDADEDDGNGSLADETRAASGCADDEDEAPNEEEAGGEEEATVESLEAAATGSTEHEEQADEAQACADAEDSGSEEQADESEEAQECADRDESPVEDDSLEHDEAEDEAEEPQPGSKVTRSDRIPVRLDVRTALGLDELLELLTKQEIIEDDDARDIVSRSTTLRSQVLKAKVGAVRSQAAARYDVSPAEIVAAANLRYEGAHRGRLDEEIIAEVLAEATGLDYCKLDPLAIDSDLVTKTLPRPFARHHMVIPVERQGSELTIALTDPFDTVLRGELEVTIPEELRYVVASKSDILSIIDRVYGFRTQVSEAQKELGDNNANSLIELVELRSNDELASASTDEHVIAAVDYLLNYAFEQRASDIHLEPRIADAVIRFRIDGILHEIEGLPKSVHGAITSRVKVLAGMNIAERRRSQDGRIKTQRAEREVELRVSSMDTAFGEKIVIRVFDPNVLLADLKDLGFSTIERERYEKWITAPNGLILVTGPTGSGKTTTLYSTLRYLSGPEINITTVEDPIEMIDPRFCQVQVKPFIDITFASALRTILRQDPDIIMVGEIRDADTANMAVQAALTGHLVLSTVHTRNAAGAITRLIELGVQRFLLSSVLRGVVAQRLVRRVCERCAVEGHLNADQIGTLGIKVPADRRDGLKVRWGEGCVECRHTGLYGRVGIFEMLDVGRRIRSMISEERDTNEIAHAARIEGMEPLRDAGIRALAEGRTTFEEVARLTTDAE